MSDDGPINLGDIRSNRSNSAMDWTPVEMLRRVLADVEAGRIKPDICMVIWSVRGEGGASSEEVLCAGGTGLELIGLAARVAAARSVP